MPRKSKGVRFEGDKDEEEEKSSRGACYPYISDILEAKRKKREKEEDEEERQIEESQAGTKEEHKEGLLEKIAEIVSDSEWFNRIRTFIRNAVANPDTQMVTMLLVREKNDVWSFEAVVSSEKPKKGTHYIKVNFGNDES